MTQKSSSDEKENNMENTDERRLLRVQAWSTGIIAAFTIALAFVAYQQYWLISENERPWILPTMDGGRAPTLPTRAGDRIEGVLLYVNFGKRPAHATVKSTMMFSSKRLPGGPGLANATGKELVIWPRPADTLDRVIGPDDLSAGDILDLRGGNGWVYVQVEVVYPGGKTGDCLEWKVNPAQGDAAPPSLGEQEPCVNDSTHYVE